MSPNFVPFGTKFWDIGWYFERSFSDRSTRSTRMAVKPGNAAAWGKPGPKRAGRRFVEV